MNTDDLKTFSKQNLEKLKENLIKRREELKQELKTKYPEVYNYLVEKGIELNNLHKYSKNIAAALAIAHQVATISPSPVPVPTPPQTELVEKDDPSSLSPLKSIAQKAWSTYGVFIKASARKYHLDPRLIFATIMTETNGNPLSYRFEPQLNDASYGLGQLLYTTAQSLGFTGQPEELYDPSINIDFIARYYKRLLDEYGTLTAEQLVRGYNAGSPYNQPHPGHLERFWEWYNIYPTITSLTATR